MTWVWDPEEAEIIRNDHDEGSRSSEAALVDAFKLLLDDWDGKRLAEKRLGEPYGQYLKGPHWRETRERAHRRAGGQCQRCYATDKRLDVHHLTYVRLGHEADADFIVLCSDCHHSEHHLST